VGKETAGFHHASRRRGCGVADCGACTGDRVRSIGALVSGAEDDAEMQARIRAFEQELALLGWTDGRNVRIDTRWATTDADTIRRHAAELAALAPDVILVRHHRRIALTAKAVS
jgi:transposase